MGPLWASSCLSMGSFLILHLMNKVFSAVSLRKVQAHATPSPHTQALLQLLFVQWARAHTHTRELLAPWPQALLSHSPGLH